MPLASHTHDYFVDHAQSSSQARVLVADLYHMRAVDTFDGSILRWTNEGSPDDAGTGPRAPTPVGALSDILVERVERRPQISSRTDRLIHAWNKTDVAQFTQVLGNGIGGVGAGGDWTLGFGSFPNDDGPAITITNNNAVSSAAMWLFNDFNGDLPRLYEVCARNLEGTVGAMSFHIVVYAVSADRYFAVRRSSTIEQHLTRVDPGSTESLNLGNFAPAAGQQDTTYGDLFGATIYLSPATDIAAPWAVAKSGGQFSAGWRETGLALAQGADLVDTNADVGWLSEPDKTHKIGILALGGGSVGTDYVSGLAWIQADGGL